MRYLYPYIYINITNISYFTIINHIYTYYYRVYTYYYYHSVYYYFRVYYYILIYHCRKFLFSPIRRNELTHWFYYTLIFAVFFLNIYTHTIYSGISNSIYTMKRHKCGIYTIYIKIRDIYTSKNAVSLFHVEHYIGIYIILYIVYVNTLLPFMLTHYYRLCKYITIVYVNKNFPYKVFMR